MPPSKQGNLGGWLTVKKTGRDDAQIKRDAEKAQALRKAKLAATRKKPIKKKASPKKKSTTAKAKVADARRRSAKDESSESEFDDYDDDGDDDDDMDAFIVDDDDDDGSVAVDSDSEDSLMNRKSTRSRSNVQVAPTGTRRAGAAAAASIKKATYADDIDGESEEDDNDDEVVEVPSDSDSSDDGLLASMYKDSMPRQSIPSKPLQRATQALKNRPNPRLMKPSKLMIPAKKERQPVRPNGRTKSFPSTLRDEDYSSSENLTSPSPVKKRNPAVTEPGKASHWQDALNDDSETDTETPMKANRSKYFQRGTTSKQTKDAGGGSLEDEDITPIKQVRNPKFGSNSSSLARLTESSDDSPDEEDLKSSDIVTDSLGRCKGGVKRDSSSLTDSSSDDEKAQKGKKIVKKKLDKKRKKLRQPGQLKASDEKDYDMQQAISRSLGHGREIISLDDSDGEKALRMALKASEKSFKSEQSKRKQKMVVELDDNNGHPYVMDLDDEENAIHAKPELRDAMEDATSDEDEGDNDETDAYAEDMEKAASSVLDTAETLSAQVLQSMVRWAGEKDGSGSKAHQGMIVDGALAMSSLQAAKPDGEFDAEAQTKDDALAGGNRGSHVWISQKEMNRVCPGVTLSDYQLVGVNWMALLHGMQCYIENRKTNVNGILADEMGLGKTVQTIAFLAWLKSQNTRNSVEASDDEDVTSAVQAKPHLIVVPVSVLSNWMREFETFCPDLNVVKYHGSQDERAEIRDQLKWHLNAKKPRSPSLDVILAPVTYFQAEKSDDRVFLRKFKYDYLVVDEAHNLRNAQSTRYKNLSMVSSCHRLLLTGTPVQNSPRELMNMLCFLMPLFSTRAEKFGDDNSGGADQMLQFFVEQKSEGTSNEEYAYKKLKQLFAPFVLRRKKADVLAQIIPPKKREVIFVELDESARSTYDSIMAAHVNKSGQKLTGAIGDHLFTNLRKAAHHPLLLRTRHKSDQEVDHLVTQFHRYGAFKGNGCTKKMVAEEVAKFNDFTIHLTALELIEENRMRRQDLEKYLLDEHDLFCSAKFIKLRTMLPQLVADGHRILVFSVWTSCLDLLGCLLEHLGLKFLRMDGSCPSADRQEKIDQFNNNPSIAVFLLSTNACGIGINLTAADTCIIHDIDFNPFNDLQAEDRCHRIGQKKQVTVYKMVAKDTVDSDIYEMQERKAKMNAAIMESSSNANSMTSDRKEMLQASMNRFMSSPPPKVKLANKENVTQEVIDLDD